MKHDYNLYRPTMRIRDIEEPTTSYYRSPDVAWSPFTTIGSLVGSRAQPHARLGDNGAPKTVRTPVFPAGISLHGIRGTAARQEASTTLPGFSLAALSLPPVGSWVVAAFEWIVDWVSKLPGRAHYALTSRHLVPTRYTIERGVQADFSGKLFKNAKVTVGSLVVALVIVWAVLFGLTGQYGIVPSHKPAHRPQPTAAVSTNASHSPRLTSSSPKPATSTPGTALGAGQGGSTPASPLSTAPAASSTPAPGTSTSSGSLSTGSGTVSTPPISVPTAPSTPITQPLTNTTAPLSTSTPSSGTTTSPLTTQLLNTSVTAPSVSAQVGGVSVSTPTVNASL